MYVVKSASCKHMKLQQRGKSVPRMKLQRQVPEAVLSPPSTLKDGMLLAPIGWWEPLRRLLTIHPVKARLVHVNVTWTLSTLSPPETTYILQRTPPSSNVWRVGYQGLWQVSQLQRKQWNGDCVCGFKLGCFPLDSIFSSCLCCSSLSVWLCPVFGFMALLPLWLETSDLPSVV